MALRKQRAEVTFFKGVDQKTDARVQMHGDLATLRNAQTDETGSIRSRNGYDALVTTVYRPDLEGIFSWWTGPIDTGEALATYDEELLIFDGDRILSWFEANDKWVYRSNATSCTCEARREEDSDAQDLAAPQAIYNNGVTCLVWVNPSTARLMYSLIDEETGAKLVQNQAVSLGFVAPTSWRLVNHGNFIICLWRENLNVFGRRLDTSNVANTVWEPIVNPFVDANSDIDAMILSDGEIGHVYVDQNNLTHVSRFDATITETAFQLVAALDPDECIAIGQHEVTLDVWVASLGHAGIATNLDFAAFDLALGAQTIPSSTHIVDAGANLDCNGLIFSDGIGPTTIGVWWDQTDTATSYHERNRRVTGVDISALAPPVVSNGTNPVWNCHIASKAFTRGNHVFFHVNHGAIDPTDPPVLDEQDDRRFVMLLMRAERTNNLQVARYPVSVGKYRQDLGAGKRWKSNPAAVSQIGANDHWMFGAAIAHRFTGDQEEDDIKIIAKAAAGIAEADFSEYSRRYQYHEKNRNLMVTGGHPQIYDGNLLRELGFPVAPEIVEVLPDPGTPGDHFGHYIAVWEWTDAAGQIHQSAPSLPVEFSGAALTSVGGSWVRVTVTRYSWSSPRQIQLVLYRTQPGDSAIPREEGTVYYRITEPNQVGLMAGADPASGFISYDDSSYWTDNLDNQIIYTNGGVLENNQGPSCACVTEWNGRMWLGGTEEPNELWFSKTILPNEGIAFSQLFRMAVGRLNSRIVGLAPMDDKLIVFKEDEVFVVYGQPPNDLGTGSTLATQRIATDTGCLTPNSIVRMPIGIMFQAPRGMYLLTRSLQVQYIGGPVEQQVFETDAEVRASVLIPDKQVVRLVTDSPDQKFVQYDYQHGQWGEHDFFPLARDAVLWDDRFVWLNDLGVVERQTNNWANSDGEGIEVYVDTSWIKLAGVQGFQRVYKLIVVGETRGDHSLELSLAYNYDETSVDNKLWTRAEVAAAWPAGGRWQFEMRPSQPKCQAIKVRIRSIFNVGEGPSPGFVLSHLVLEVGVKDELMRVPLAVRR